MSSGSLPDPYPDKYFIPALPSAMAAAAAVSWRDDIPYVVASADHDIVGPITDSSPPISVVSWEAAGAIKETGMEWWRQCMTLFMRHI